MKIQEAINRMKWRVETATDIVGKGEDGKAYEDMEIAIAALEKQLPVTPAYHINTIPVSKTAVKFIKIYECPLCHAEVGDSYNYCPECGQKIDRD